MNNKEIGLIGVLFSTILMMMAGWNDILFMRIYLAIVSLGLIYTMYVYKKLYAVYTKEDEE